MKVLVTGAGGFIGHHLVKRLKLGGHYVVGVDLKRPEFEPTQADEFLLQDLRDPLWWTRYRISEIDEIYALAADMGGMGFISKEHARILTNGLQIAVNTLKGALELKAKRYLFTSSVCCYPKSLLQTPEASPIREQDAYPADPPEAYGWEKLTVEQLCRYYREAYGLETRIVRLNNTFGPLGTWKGGREKAPAALCRKVATAKLKDEPSIEVWGDGKQTRTFLYVDDTVNGIISALRNDYPNPTNLGNSFLVSVDWMVDTISRIADWPVEKRYVDGPQGARGRLTDNSLAKEKWGWEAKVSIEEGLVKTYEWIEEQVRESVR